MALTPLRKKLNLACGLILLAGGAFALWPLVSGPLEMRAFCRELVPGSSEAAIRSLAAAKGFQVSPTTAEQAHVYDFRSLGKFSCTLQLKGGALLSATFVAGD